MAGRAFAAATIMSIGIIAGAGPAPAASATDGLPPPPVGQWTQVGDDQFEHFGCKVSLGSGQWRVRTATYRTDPDASPEIGIYAAIIEGRGTETATVIDTVNSKAWDGRWVYTRGLVATSRDQAVWIQCDCYGPPRYDGDLRMPIRKLTSCG
jgi:hypothetical protein